MQFCNAFKNCIGRNKRDIGLNCGSGNDGIGEFYIVFSSDKNGFFLDRICQFKDITITDEDFDTLNFTVGNAGIT